MTHLTKNKTYTYKRDGKRLTLHPDEPTINHKDSKENYFLTARQFEKASLEAGVVYTLVGRIKESKQLEEN